MGRLLRRLLSPVGKTACCGEAVEGGLRGVASALGCGDALVGVACVS